MVVLDIHKEVPSTENISLREERKRTGRYVAAGTALFLSLLGVYQTLIQSTPEYAALFAPAVIMFVYVLWILYASRHQNARLLKMNEAARLKQMEEEVPSIIVESLLPEKVDNEKQINNSSAISEDAIPSVVVEALPEKEETGKQFNRSYSIA